MPARNKSIHYSPVKGKFQKSIKDSIKEAKYASEISIKVAQEFWKTCYPDKKLPQYILKLNYETFYNNAKKRVYIH